MLNVYLVIILYGYPPLFHIYAYPNLQGSVVIILLIQSEHSMLMHGKISPPTDFRHQHTAPVAMPHLPITATTKMAEIKSPSSPSSPAGSPSFLASEASSTNQSSASAKQTDQPTEEPVQPGDTLILIRHPNDGFYFSCLNVSGG